MLNSDELIRVSIGNLIGILTTAGALPNFNPFTKRQEQAKMMKKKTSMYSRTTWWISKAEQQEKKESTNLDGLLVKIDCNWK